MFWGCRGGGFKTCVILIYTHPRFWGVFGVFLAVFGVFLAVFGLFLAIFGVIFDPSPPAQTAVDVRFGSFLATFWPFLGHFWPFLGHFWAIFGPFWGVPGGPPGGSRGVLIYIHMGPRG